MANESSAAAQRLNERNAEFWREQSEVRERRLADPILAELAKQTVWSEAAKGLPIRWHRFSMRSRKCGTRLMLILQKTTSLQLLGGCDGIWNSFRPN